MRIIRIFDTTLRDGYQSLDASLSAIQKVTIAQQLERLNVDIIEAGFPITSVDEFRAVKKIAETVKKPVVCALGRLVDKDLDRCWEAIKHAERPRLHTFIATSDLHMKYKLRKSRTEVLKLTRYGVERAKKYCDDIEFTVEDGSRSDFEFMTEVIEVAIEAGTTTINIPDTVGYAQPDEFGNLIKSVIKQVPKIKDVNLSVHCHNDLGLAVANALEGIKNGASQVECTINGIGERAGNASLEEIVMVLKTRPDYYQAKTNIITEELFDTSKLISDITGFPVQKNKAIVGQNAFVHKAGIHQDGILKNRATYEIMTPETVGWKGQKLVISKHSGQHAIIMVLDANKINPSKDSLPQIIAEIKDYTDKHFSISNEKIVEIANEVISQSENS